MMWSSFDDDVVRKVNYDEDVIIPEAYILFYSKMSVDEIYR